MCEEEKEIQEPRVSQLGGEWMLIGPLALEESINKTLALDSF